MKPLQTFDSLILITSNYQNLKKKKGKKTKVIVMHRNIITSYKYEFLVRINKETFTLFTDLN